MSHFVSLKRVFGRPSVCAFANLLFMHAVQVLQQDIFISCLALISEEEMSLECTILPLELSRTHTATSSGQLRRADAIRPGTPGS